MLNQAEGANPASGGSGGYPSLGSLLRPVAWWQWLAYLICLAILVWIGTQAGPVCFVEGDDLNIALGVKAAVKGVFPLNWAYRFATSAGLYYPLYFLAGLGLDPLAAFFFLSLACAYLFVLVFSLFAARLLSVHLSLCLLSLLSLQEVIASFLYPNDMIIGLLPVACGLAVQVIRPRFWLPLTALCAALAILVRIDLAQAVLLNLILVHFPGRADSPPPRKAFLTDLALGASVVLIWLGFILAGRVEIGRAVRFTAGHLEYFLSDLSNTIYVNTETLHSMLGPWLFLCVGGVLWMAWDRRLVPCLMVAAFCLLGVVMIFPITTTAKYLLPHLAVASLGASYALGCLLSGGHGAKVLAAALAGVCLLFPLVGNYSLNRHEVSSWPLQKGCLAAWNGNRLLNVGPGRALCTHDGTRLSGGYLFLPPPAVHGQAQLPPCLVRGGPPPGRPPGDRLFQQHQGLEGAGHGHLSPGRARPPANGTRGVDKSATGQDRGPQGTGRPPGPGHAVRRGQHPATGGGPALAAR